MSYYEDGTITLHHGGTLEVLRSMADQSVDCCVTSPPYFGLRSYLPAEHPDKALEIGTEKTPVEFVENLRAVFEEVRRVLADDGTLWLNLGDSYSRGDGSFIDGPQQSRNGQGVCGPRELHASANRASGAKSFRHGIPPKNLLGVPWRVAFALQDDGWILRNAIIWHKPNAMPESVVDRLSTRYELLFMFSKSRTYWFDLDSIREPVQENTHTGHVFGGARKAAALTTGSSDRRTGGAYVPTGKGRNPGDVWTIPTVPFPGAHFAAFPPELPRRCIVAGCKPDGVVLDPFSGSGTTGMVAVKHGRKYVGIDLNAEYLELSLRTRLQPLWLI